MQHFWGLSELQRSTILLMHNLWQQFLPLFQPSSGNKSMPKCFSGARWLCSSEWNSRVVFSRMSSLFKSSKQLFNFDLPSKPMSQLFSIPISSNICLSWWFVQNILSVFKVKSIFDNNILNYSSFFNLFNKVYHY